MVTDEATMSNRPWARTSRMVLNFCLTKLTLVMPKVLAAAFTRSTSKPLTVLEPGSVNSNGL